MVVRAAIARASEKDARQSDRDRRHQPLAIRRGARIARQSPTLHRHAIAHGQRLFCSTRRHAQSDNSSLWSPGAGLLAARAHLPPLVNPNGCRGNCSCGVHAWLAIIVPPNDGETGANSYERSRPHDRHGVRHRAARIVRRIGRARQRHRGQSGNRMVASSLSLALAPLAPLAALVIAPRSWRRPGRSRHPRTVNHATGIEPAWPG